MNQDEFQIKKVQFENELYSFFDRNKVVIKNNSKRLCHFFEMACYSRVVHYYRNQNFTIQPRSPMGNESVFKFKSTTRGSPNNYSFFRISRNIVNSAQDRKEYDIRSNIPIRSSYDSGTYVPDIVVSNASDELDIQQIENQNLITFCEVKYLKPHPEMLANFIGMLHELTPDLLDGPNVRGGLHPAPALIASGHSSENVDQISIGMRNRYTVNFALNYENNSGGLAVVKRIGELPL
jgi:hypothetical protein